MKKSELTQITQLIEHLVTKEVRKQLPTIIAETFQNMMGKSVVTEERQPIAKSTRDVTNDDELELKTSLKDMFSGVKSIPPTVAPVKAQRQLAKDPLLNAVLNETSGLRQYERNMGGMPAFLNQYQQNAVAGGMPSPAEMGHAMAEGEPAFTRGMPSLPVGSPPVLREGQESSHAPMAAIPEGVSVLDVARQVPLDKPVAHALTRNYSQMMKLIDKKKSGKL